MALLGEKDSSASFWHVGSIKDLFGDKCLDYFRVIPRDFPLLILGYSPKMIRDKSGEGPPLVTIQGF